MNELPNKYWAIVRDGRVVYSGGHLGTTLEYLSDMAKKMFGTVTFGDRPFVRNEVGDFFGFTWQQLVDKQMGRNSFASAAERTGGNPGEEPQKVEKSVIRGVLPKEDLESMIYIMRDISLSDDEMAKKISEATNYVSPEAGIILVRAWRDAGRSEKDWQNDELMTFIRKQLITKMGADMNKTDRIANKIAFSWDIDEHGKDVVADFATAMRPFGTVLSARAAGPIAEDLPPDIQITIVNKSRSKKATIWIVQGFGGTTIEAQIAGEHGYKKMFDLYYWPPMAYDSTTDINRAVRIFFNELIRQGQWVDLPVPAYAASEILKVARELISGEVRLNSLDSRTRRLIEQISRNLTPEEVGTMTYHDIPEKPDEPYFGESVAVIYERDDGVLIGHVVRTPKAHIQGISGMAEVIYTAPRGSSHQSFAATITRLFNTGRVAKA